MAGSQPALAASVRAGRGGGALQRQPSTVIHNWCYPPKSGLPAVVNDPPDPLSYQLFRRTAARAGRNPRRLTAAFDPITGHLTRTLRTRVKNHAADSR